MLHMGEWRKSAIPSALVLHFGCKISCIIPTIGVCFIWQRQNQFTIETLFLHTLIFPPTASYSYLASNYGENLFVIGNIIYLEYVTGTVQEVFKKRCFA